MKAFCYSPLPSFLRLTSGSVLAEKLTLAHVAINPSQGMFWVAKDSGILAKYGFTADMVLDSGHAANDPGADRRRFGLRRRRRAGGVARADARRRCDVILSTLANYPSSAFSCDRIPSSKVSTN